MNNPIQLGAHFIVFTFFFISLTFGNEFYELIIHVLSYLKILRFIMLLHFMFRVIQEEKS